MSEPIDLFYEGFTFAYSHGPWVVPIAEAGGLILGAGAVVYLSFRLARTLITRLGSSIDGGGFAQRRRDREFHRLDWAIDALDNDEYNTEQKRKAIKIANKYGTHNEFRRRHSDLLGGAD